MFFTEVVSAVLHLSVINSADASEALKLTGHIYSNIGQRGQTCTGPTKVNPTDPAHINGFGHTTGRHKGRREQAGRKTHPTHDPLHPLV